MYDEGSLGSGVAGSSAPGFEEYDGHLYRRNAFEEAARGSRDVDVRGVAEDGPVLAVGFGSSKRATVSYAYNGVVGTTFEPGLSGKASIGILTDENDVASVEMTGGGDPGALLAIVTYVRAD